MPVGAQVIPEQNATRFRVWAPLHSSVKVVFENGRDAMPLRNEENGYFSAVVENALAGTRYKYQLGAIPPTFIPIRFRVISRTGRIIFRK